MQMHIPDCFMSSAKWLVPCSCSAPQSSFAELIPSTAACDVKPPVACRVWQPWSSFPFILCTQFFIIKHLLEAVLLFSCCALYLAFIKSSTLTYLHVALKLLALLHVAATPHVQIRGLYAPIRQAFRVWTLHKLWFVIRAKN